MDSKRLKRQKRLLNNGMSCIEQILSRRSIRRYKPEPIDSQVKDRILEAGRQAPSAANRQPWHFIVIEDQETKEKISSTGRYRSFVRDSDFTIVGCYDSVNQATRRWGTIDVTIAMQNMQIAAQVQGIGSCWIGDFQQEDMHQLLNIPKDMEVVALMSFGIPDEIPVPRPKKPREEAFHKNKW